MGSPRITAELNGAAEQADGRVNRERVARPMRAAGICGHRRRRPVRTTVPDQAGAKRPDPLERDFTAPAPNRRYVSDITGVSGVLWTWEEFLPKFRGLDRPGCGGGSESMEG